MASLPWVRPAGAAGVACDLCHVVKLLGMYSLEFAGFLCSVCCVYVKLSQR